MLQRPSIRVNTLELVGCETGLGQRPILGIAQMISEIGC